MPLEVPRPWKCAPRSRPGRAERLVKGRRRIRRSSVPARCGHVARLCDVRRPAGVPRPAGVRATRRAVRRTVHGQGIQETRPPVRARQGPADLSRRRPDRCHQARPARPLPGELIELSKQFQDRGVGLAVLDQGIDTTTSESPDPPSIGIFKSKKQTPDLERSPRDRAQGWRPHRWLLTQLEPVSDEFRPNMGRHASSPSIRTSTAWCICQSSRDRRRRCMVTSLPRTAWCSMPSSQ